MFPLSHRCHISHRIMSHTYSYLSHRLIPHTESSFPHRLMLLTDTHFKNCSESSTSLTVTPVLAKKLHSDTHLPNKCTLIPTVHCNCIVKTTSTSSHTVTPTSTNNHTVKPTSQAAVRCHPLQPTAVQYHPLQPASSSSSDVQ